MQRGGDDFTRGYYDLGGKTKTVPRTGTRLDVGGLGADGRDPFAHSLGHELRAVVGSYVGRDALRGTA